MNEITQFIIQNKMILIGLGLTYVAIIALSHAIQALLNEVKTLGSENLSKLKGIVNKSVFVTIITWTIGAICVLFN